MLGMATRKDDWLTPTQAALLKGVTPQAITKAIRESRLPAERWGKLYLLRRNVIEAWQPGPQGRRRDDA